MIKRLLVLALVFVSITAFGQTGTVTGKLVDSETGEGLLGANVVIEGTTIGAIVDLNGAFTISGAPSGNQTLDISYIGYETRKVEVNVPNGGTVNTGTLKLNSAAVGLSEVQVIASVAIDRKTPVAVSTIKSKEIQEKVGNQEFPEMLRNTPSIYVTKQGGGFGDSRINVRGFDQRNVAVMINGIPVNDMENGAVYWSNWAGLADVTSSMQVQRGLGASKLAVPSVGGSINIITNAAEMDKGGSVSASFGNDGYQKYGLMYSTGLMDNGLALTVQGTHTRGNGYVDGTMFRGYSYFLSLAKVFNDQHSIHFTAFGAPQRHNQRQDAQSYTTFEQYGIKYNANWGYLDGEEFAMEDNFYHKPQISLNHYWNINNDTELSTSVYASFGRGGGSGDRGSINRTRYRALPKTQDGLLRFDDIKAWNSGQTVADFGADNTTWLGPNEDPNYDGQFAGEYVLGWSGPGQGIVKRASMNEHNWFGVISNLSKKINDNWSFVGGVDFRYYKGLHYTRVQDLLGLAALYDDNDVNNVNHYVTEEGRDDNNIIAYNNDGLVNWLGLYTQIEYTNDKVSAFVSLSGSNQGFKRIDYFNYLDSDPEQETDWQNFLGGTIKAGVNYLINDHHNVYVNGGYFSRQPIFDNVFVNFVNDINEDAENQTVNAIEVGYGYRSGILAANLNLYRTSWGNRQFTLSRIDADNNGDNNDRAIFDDVAQLHQGIEFDFVLTPMKGLSINGMASFGDWVYSNDFNASQVFNDNNELLDNDVVLYTDGVKVADAAQVTFSLGANYEVIRGGKIYVNYFHADNVYAQFDLDNFQTPGNQVWELPSYGLMDAGFSYNFNINKLDFTWTLNVNNLLDEEYISEAFTNELTDDPNSIIPGTDNADVSNEVFFGWGRSWNTGIKMRF
ncbi:TonB-dependent receptor [Marinigracilibium pacificum]|uniref:TonB-dependent receptor n=1 Tax=Marinigracilibium pacificum TaxID=2729599 RepID=A0A848IZ92_9BACT|nr:TonB-dependent receptor [Marinigracilibium pacificum]NMM49597.1 TonB-dependent receptor [Marinigracilibium pacificum]